MAAVPSSACRHLRSRSRRWAAARSGLALLKPMDPLAALEAAVARQADEVATYSSPSAAKTLELVRAIDRVVMGELLDRPDIVARWRELHAVMGWNVAHALAAVLPQAGDEPPLRLFPSLPEAQGRVDDLLFASGALSLGERMLSC